MPIPTVAQSVIVYKCGQNYASANVTVTYTGNIGFYICADGDTESWEYVSLGGSNVLTSHTFTTQGGEIKWQIIGDPGATVTAIWIEPTTV